MRLTEIMNGKAFRLEDEQRRRILLHPDGGNYIPRRYEIRCDGAVDCDNHPNRAPRLVVPSKTPHAPKHWPVGMWTTLHFCELHAVPSRRLLEVLLTARTKGDVETYAKRARPIDFKADFDAAFIQYFLTTTPEYRRFLIGIGAKDVTV
jgi:hypothetical protein